MPCTPLAALAIMTKTDADSDQIQILIHIKIQIHIQQVQIIVKFRSSFKFSDSEPCSFISDSNSDTYSNSDPCRFSSDSNSDSNSDAFVAQLCCSSWLLRFVAQICCSALLLRLVSQICCSYFKVQFQTSNVHIHMQLELLLCFHTQFQIQSPRRCCCKSCGCTSAEKLGLCAGNKTETASASFT